jgi:spore coat polysaccharide biosynthesis protein SpsF (cytidylyltransferase family)
MVLITAATDIVKNNYNLGLILKPLRMHQLLDIVTKYMDERQKMIRPNCHPTYNERHEKIIELIDWTLEKYKEAATVTNIQNNQQNDEAIIIDNIIEELDKKRDIAINKKNKALLKDEVSIYRLEENTIDYVLFMIREGRGKL